MPERSLVLFDIDGTLLRSEGAGIAAMLSAFRQIHGDLGFSFDGLEIAGALDGLLFAKLMSRHGLPAHAEAEEHFRNTYRAELDRTMTAERTRRNREIYASLQVGVYPRHVGRKARPTITAPELLNSP